MKILIDADACPVKDIVVNAARKRRLDVIMVSNVNHMIHDDYSEIVTVDADHDMADHVIVSKTVAGDLVITQDYGLAALVLAKNAYAIHQDGWFFSSDNIDGLLMKRHLHQKMRQSSKRHRGPSKRTKASDILFKEALEAFLNEKTSGA